MRQRRANSAARPRSTSAQETISASAASAASPVACALAMPPVPTMPKRTFAAIPAPLGTQGSSAVTSAHPPAPANALELLEEVLQLHAQVLALPAQQSGSLPFRRRERALVLEGE